MSNVFGRCGIDVYRYSEWIGSRDLLCTEEGVRTEFGS